MTSLEAQFSKKLCLLCDNLMEDYRENSIMRNGKYRTGLVKFEQFYPSESKTIIDKIDVILGNHYGLTNEEFDFIINYAIKYRMGVEND